MSSTAPQSTTLATGLAMFSMFFGAGNVVFPLALGQYAQDQASFAILGFLITAVGVPFIGLIAMTLFDGDTKKFFSRIGNVPGFILACVIMALIGPFGAIPRCVALSYAALNVYLPSLSIVWFSALSCLLIFVFTYKQSKIIDLLGYVLTPILLLALGIIIVLGLVSPATAPVSHLPDYDAFVHGLSQGYQTMDLLGAFFFSSVVLVCLKKGVDASQHSNYQLLIRQTLKASCIGAGLLGVIYVGFGFVASIHGESLINSPADQLIGNLSQLLLGPYAGVVACVAVALACLTTAIALSTVFAEFLHHEVSSKRIGYIPALIGTLIVTFFISTLNFSGIVKLLAPILQVCYPALIVLSVVNIANKLWGFKWVKTPVFVTFVLTVAHYTYHYWI